MPTGISLLYPSFPRTFTKFARSCHTTFHAGEKEYDVGETTSRLAAREFWENIVFFYIFAFHCV